MARKAWTEKEEKFIRKNIHLSNEEIALKLDRSQASVENKVRELGLARIFQPDEIEVLKKVWGRRRSAICAALPRFTWRQISKKANNIGLPPLKDIRESAHLFSIINAMGEYDGVSQKWIDAGLKVTNDKTRKMKNNILLVDIDDFWKFAAAHPDVVDITLLRDNVFDVLGVPTEEIIEMQKTAVPFKRCRPKLSARKKADITRMYYTSEKSSEEIANRFNISVDTLRHTAMEYKQPGQKRNQSSVVTKTFLQELEKLYYQENKTYQECAEILNCSKSSVSRGISKIIQQRKDKK